ncbi:uncharacterized protein K02A2.6-like [Phlebotomus papatasi]|uniref:uncharacterized protein K02A2.6-like n=1 Tax=Phlebotomus papatasi TaxID=29031 RepID=UPI0024845C25|nr:uncharacterized protein K02A2.6-like [Phlebotomus papatasi]
MSEEGDSSNRKEEKKLQTMQSSTGISGHQNIQLTLPTNLEYFQPQKGTWSRWLMRLEENFEFFGITAEDSQKRMLTQYMGCEAYDKLCDRIAPRVPRNLTYKEIADLLQKYYDPPPQEIIEVYKFQKREQNEGESCDDYLAALRKLAVNCNFGCSECDFLLKALRNQFVIGLRNKAIQKRLFEKKDLTLDHAVEIAKAMESSEEGQEVVAGKQKMDVNKVAEAEKKLPENNVPEKEEEQGKPPIRRCYRCGVSTHLANKCPQKDAIICYACNKKGHMAKFCLTTGKKEQKGGEKLNKVEDLMYQESKFVGKVWLGVKVGGRDMNFEVDSGSPISIISSHDKDTLFPKAEIFPTSRNFVGYNNSEIDVLGYVKATVEVRGRVLRDMNLYIALGSKKAPLLGREWIRRLNWLNWNQVMSIHKVSENIKLDEEIVNLKRDFKNVFDDSLGKIVGIKAELKLKDDAKPVFLKARGVPFARKEAVGREIDKLVEEGVFVKVNQSPWATPIVVVPKASGKLRLCGDYSTTLNPNLVIDRHPLPTVEELFCDMAGGEKFSKLDLTQAYMQLEVREEDQEMLTVNTHKGLYRPTRMMYGVSSAVAIWQRVMETLLQDVPGVKVFLDDIRITGSNDQEHLTRLREVLKRLNPKKIEALEGMPRPKNRDEVRAYVGFINYYGRFFENLSTKLYPINNLLKEDSDSGIKWDSDCEKAFQGMRDEMRKEVFLGHYDPKEQKAAAHGNADGLSRLPLPKTSEYETDDPEIVQLNSINTLPVTLSEIQHETKIDKEVKKLIEGLKLGKVISKEDRFNINMEEFSFKQGCLVRGERTYIPGKLRNVILQELHDGHVGMTKMKMMARSYCWWVGIDRDIEKLVSNCTNCQENRANPSKVPVHTWESATKPFERVHIDYAGPVYGKWLLIVVDSYSKWPEVVSVTDQTTETTITELRKIFSTHGLPEVIVSDQGRQFMSCEFKEFCKNNGIVHKTGAPYHPATNGQAEREPDLLEVSDSDSQSEDEVFEDAVDDPSSSTNEVSLETGPLPSHPEPLRRSKRTIRPPDRLNL